MSVEFLDTNVLIYALDSSSTTKQKRAAELISSLAIRGQGAISTQVLIEFCAVATKKLSFSQSRVETVVRGFSAWSLAMLTPDDLIAALRLQESARIFWWDSLILASALKLRADILWTEDLQHGRRFGALEVRNPFLP